MGKFWRAPKDSRFLIPSLCNTKENGAENCSKKGNKMKKKTSRRLATAEERKIIIENLTQIVAEAGASGIHWGDLLRANEKRPQVRAMGLDVYTLHNICLDFCRRSRRRGGPLRKIARGVYVYVPTTRQPRRK
ncbi:MAG: hypothetical protein ABSG56_37850 [Bryobacteraceae bacterium]